MADTATQRPRAAGGASRACFKCGKTGHWSKDCSAPREEWIPQQPRTENGVPSSPGDLTGDLTGDALNGDAPAPAAKKQTNRKPRFTAVEHVLGPNGVAYVANVIPERFAKVAKGPGHEFGDFARLVGLYREWTRKMYPHASHEAVIKKVKTLSKTREVRATVREFKERSRMENDDGDGDGDADAGRADDPVEAEDVFFPDDDDDAENEDPAFPDDDEEEWDEARDGDGGGDDDEREMAVLLERESVERNVAPAAAAAAPAAAAAAPAAAAAAKDADDASRLADAEAKSAAFDEARRAEANALDVNFDESSEDDDDFEIATRARPARGVSAGGVRGKARKKTKAPKRKRAGGTHVQSEKNDDAEPGFPEHAPDGRKRLGRKGGGSKPARGDEEDSDSDVAEAALRRPRRKVVAALSDSDDDDAPVPAAMGGDALAGDVPTTADPPSALFDEDE